MSQHKRRLVVVSYSLVCVTLQCVIYTDCWINANRLSNYISFSDFFFILKFMIEQPQDGRK